MKEKFNWPPIYCPYCFEPIFDSPPIECDSYGELDDLINGRLTANEVDSETLKMADRYRK